jgi:hypothetical protein
LIVKRKSVINIPLFNILSFNQPGFAVLLDNQKRILFLNLLNERFRMQVKQQLTSSSSISQKKGYNYDEAFNEALRYFKGDELAAKVWTSKYALKDSFGNIFEKSPDEMHRRHSKRNFKN